MEITIMSAQGLKKATSVHFCHRVRPFITITSYPPYPCNGDEKCDRYTTRVDDHGGVNPTWGDKFHVPIDPCFLANRCSFLCLQLYTKRLIMRPVQLGWCRIPVSDIGYPPENSVKYLSYRMMARDGTRCEGIVNIAIKWTGFQQVAPRYSLLDSGRKDPDSCESVIGIPVTAFPLININAGRLL